MKNAPVEAKDLKTEVCKVCGEALKPDTECRYALLARKENEVARAVRESDAVDRLLTSASSAPPSFLRPPRVGRS